MPWSSGTFSRTNGTFTGSTLWNSDKGAGTKITSANHDTHDQDLSDGINSCINKDGENSPTTNISWNNHKITSLGNGSATTDAAAYGQTITGLSLDSGTLVLTAARSAGALTVDLSPVNAGVGGVTLSDTQTITGKKTFTTNTTTIAKPRFNGAYYHDLNVLTSGSSVAIDTTSHSEHYLLNNQAMTLSFTLPSGSDTDLGDDYCLKGTVFVRNTTGHGTLTLNTMGFSSVETINSQATGSSSLHSLTYVINVVGGSSKYAILAWVTS